MSKKQSSDKNVNESLPRRVGFAGFEYSHHPHAVSAAVDKLRVSGRYLDVVFWSARDGVFDSVKEHFPDCEFIQSEAEVEKSLQETVCAPKYRASDKLTDLEIKHYSYTYSRETIFRDPREFKKSEIKQFNTWFIAAKIFLEKRSLDAVFFIKMPHSILDISLYYAAKRLDIMTFYTDGPFFGDFISLNKDDKDPVIKCKKNHNMWLSFVQMMQLRDLRQNLMPPDYTNPEKLRYLPDIPKPKTSFYESILEKKIFALTSSDILTKIVGKSTNIIVSKYAHVYRKYCFINFVSKNCFSSKKYVLVLLQFHPEQTTSISACDTPFEEERILKLASLFRGMDVVVREHPTNLKNKLFHQYRSIKSLRKMTSPSNVHYIWPNTSDNYYSQVKNAQLTVSTSGTVALESIQLGVPTVHFCRSFAEGMPGVISVRSVDELNMSILRREKRRLAGMSRSDLMSAAFKAALARYTGKAFLTGYHTSDYKVGNYLDDASIVLHDFLKFKLWKGQ